MFYFFRGTNFLKGALEEFFVKLTLDSSKGKSTKKPIS
jgi:hypothetical protein